MIRHVSTPTLQHWYARTHEIAMRGPWYARTICGLVSYALLCEMTERVYVHVAREEEARRAQYAKNAERGWN